jgi:hypothetical protein
MGFIGQAPKASLGSARSSTHPTFAALSFNRVIKSPELTI